jgi:uncharacterized protein (TIGR03067 family)
MTATGWIPSCRGCRFGLCLALALAAMIAPAARGQSLRNMGEPLGGPTLVKGLADELSPAVRAGSRALASMAVEQIGSRRRAWWGRGGRLHTMALRYFWFPLDLDADDAKPDAAPEKDLEPLQGAWELVSARRDGKDMPPAAVKTFRGTIRGDRLTVTREGKVVEEGTLKLDPATKPARLDFVLDDRGRTAAGIYEQDGDTFKVCYARPGKDRPRDFGAARGSGHSLAVWRRANK